jgi:hypothetical protein
MVIVLVFRVKYCTTTNVDSFNENNEQYLSIVSFVRLCVLTWQQNHDRSVHHHSLFL